jgi:hypothetical protein
VGKRGVTRDDSVKFTKAEAQGGDENSFRALLRRNLHLSVPRLRLKVMA